MASVCWSLGVSLHDHASASASARVANVNDYANASVLSDINGFVVIVRYDMTNHGLYSPLDQMSRLSFHLPSHDPPHHQLPNHDQRSPDLRRYWSETPHSLQ